MESLNDLCFIIEMSVDSLLIASIFLYSVKLNLYVQLFFEFHLKRLHLP